VAVQKKRRTQLANYWLEDLVIGKDDLESLYEWYLEEPKPRTLDELGQRIVEMRTVEEEQTLLKQTDRGLIYQPQESFEVGQSVVFPALDYAAGKVVAVRPGDNPRYGPFSVIQVAMEDDGEGVREFATHFELDHPLNRSAILLDDSEDVLSASQLYELHAQSIRARVGEVLERSEEFVQIRGVWFLRGLLPEVTPFHLNIAEAMIDERGQPLTASQLLEEVELPAGKSGIRSFALSYALSQDERFAETSLAGEPTWYLSALIPPGVTERPARLAPMHRAHGGEWLNRELRDIALEIGDEADELEEAPASEGVERVSFHLNFPHLREGTLPLAGAALALLRERPAERFVVTFRDARNKEEMRGWMIPGEHYGWGLGDWYKRHELPVGAVLELSRGEGPYAFGISFEKGRRRTEWLRQAKAVDGQLTFAMQRKAYECQYDKHLNIDLEEPEELDPLWTLPGDGSSSLFELLTDLFPELAKLSGQGLVHAKTLYSAANLTRRTGAVPVFAELTRHACFDPVGDGNWVYDESLRHVTYETVDDMRRRPSSRRPDVIVDTVYQYALSSEVEHP